MGIFGLRGRAVQKVRDLVEEHLHGVQETLGAMSQTMEAFLAQEGWEALEERAVEVHRRESRADDARREAETALMRGALLAGTRRNLLHILDDLDLVANSAEAAADFLVYQRVGVPEILHPLIRDFLKGLGEEWACLRAAVTAFLSADAAETTRQSDEVDHWESHLDEIHRRLILRLFATDLPLAEKIQARDFLGHLESCANAMEEVADLLVVAVAASLSP